MKLYGFEFFSSLDPTRLAKLAFRALALTALLFSQTLLAGEETNICKLLVSEQGQLWSALTKDEESTSERTSSWLSGLKRAMTTAKHPQYGFYTLLRSPQSTNSAVELIQSTLSVSNRKSYELTHYARGLRIEVIDALIESFNVNLSKDETHFKSLNEYKQKGLEQIHRIEASIDAEEKTIALLKLQQTLFLTLDPLTSYEQAVEANLDHQLSLKQHSRWVASCLDPSSCNTYNSDGWFELLNKKKYADLQIQINQGRITNSRDKIRQLKDYLRGVEKLLNAERITGLPILRDVVAAIENRTGDDFNSLLEFFKAIQWELPIDQVSHAPRAYGRPKFELFMRFLYLNQNRGINLFLAELTASDPTFGAISDMIVFLQSNTIIANSNSITKLEQALAELGTENTRLKNQLLQHMSKIQNEEPNEAREFITNSEKKESLWSHFTSRTSLGLIVIAHIFWDFLSPYVG